MKSQRPWACGTSFTFKCDNSRSPPSCMPGLLPGAPEGWEREGSNMTPRLCLRGVADWDWDSVLMPMGCPVAQAIVWGSREVLAEIGGPRAVSTWVMLKGM
jgi:hypothetical protein